MRKFNIITSMGTWTISGENLYLACKKADLRLSDRYPRIIIMEIKEINLPFKTNIQPQPINFN